tara:strand:+ start:117 stop:527 length:411 start_codon:yes stop_codon:yes gene_type:complete
MFETIIGQKPRKSSFGGRARHGNRSGVVDLVRRKPLMFGKVENGVTKSCQIFCRKNIAGETHFWAEIFHFFSREALLLFARVDIGVTKLRQKKPKKKKKKIGSEIFFSKVGVRIVPFSAWGIFILAAEKLIVSGGV